MTKAEILSRVWVHFIDGEAPPGVYDPNSKGTACVYRNDEGHRCAVGLLIPDREYRMAMEGLRVYQLLKKYADREWAQELAPHLGLLRKLQHAHDTAVLNATPERPFRLQLRLALEKIQKDESL